MVGTPLTPQAPHPGSGDLMRLMDFLKNSKEYRKRWDELEALRNEVNELIALHGKIKDIERLHSEATSDREEAARLRSATESEARTTKASAETEAKRLVDDANTEADAVKQAAYELHQQNLAENERLTTWNTELEGAAENIRRRDDDLKEKEEGYAARRQALDEASADFDAYVERVKAATEA